jgi:hypothetical protein
MTRREKSDLKTITRRLKIVKVRSRKHKQKTFVAKEKPATKQNSFQYIRKSVSKYVKSERCYLPIRVYNWIVIQLLGYTPKTTKRTKNALHLQPRNIRVDGWSCKERRLILLAQRKLQNAA